MQQRDKRVMKSAWILAWILAAGSGACVEAAADKTVGSSGGSGGNGGSTTSAGGAAGMSTGGAGGGIRTLSLGEGGATVSKDAGNSADAQSNDNCAESAKVVYLVTEQSYLYAFDPRESGLAAYRRIGMLSCETASTPQSMSVDRLGKAYVFYSSGHLYYVNTSTAECTPTGYQHPVSPTKSFNQLGMGFTAETPDSDRQVLFIQSPDFGLATVDLQSLAVNKLNVLPSVVAELTGGPDAVLFGFQADTAELSQVDRTTYQTRSIHKFSLTGVGAFAFSRYAGVFYIFTAPSMSAMTTTTMYDPQTNTESVRDRDIGVTVVGAGQSICVPPPFIP
jgi:hypothetical protein